jgi:hypothetical protein
MSKSKLQASPLCVASGFFPGKDEAESLPAKQFVGCPTDSRTHCMTTAQMSDECPSDLPMVFVRRMIVDLDRLAMLTDEQKNDCYKLERVNIYDDADFCSPAICSARVSICSSIFRFRELALVVIFSPLFLAVVAQVTISSKPARSRPSGRHWRGHPRRSRSLRCRCPNVTAPTAQGLATFRSRTLRPHEDANVGLAVLSGSSQILADPLQVVRLVFLCLDNDPCSGTRGFGSQGQDAVSDLATRDVRGEKP